MNRPHLIIWFLLLACFIASLTRSPAADPDPRHELARRLNQEFVEVAEEVSPSVVVITVTKKSGASDHRDEDDDTDQSVPPEFKREYRQRMRDVPLHGQGSGVILRDDGYILTNGHVVEDTVKVEVRLQDGREFKAEVRGIDRLSDLAVVKIDDASGLRPARLANSDKARVGEFAIAIGAPFSLDYSVTFGHVSAKGRSNVVPGFEGASMDQDFIQTDANINPGNSGGPLVNIDGEVIGINTLIAGLRTGIGFAIPSNLAKEIADQLIARGKFSRPWLGIGLRAFRDDLLLRERYKQISDGVVVSSILPQGPASRSDLKVNDIIVGVDSNHVANPQQFRSQLRTKPIGQPATLDIFRKDKSLQVRVSPGEWNPDLDKLVSAATNSTSEFVSPSLGLTVQPLTQELADKYGVEKVDGIVVVGVENGMPAAVRGLKPGDIITSLDQKAVTDLQQFREAFEKASPQRGVALNFKRAGKPRFEILKEGSN